MEQQTFDYDIFRDGVLVGSHQVQVQYHEECTRAICLSRIEIGLMGLTFYRFRYESEEEWDEQGLNQLIVSVDDDVEHMQLEGHRENGRFLWTNNEADPIAQEMPVYPTNHWPPSVLSQTRVLNTLTGSGSSLSFCAALFQYAKIAEKY